jgi:hypothetical protein
VIEALVGAIVDRFRAASPLELVALATFSIALAAASVALTAWAIVRLPSDYFVVEKPPLPLAGRAWIVRVVVYLARNLAGLTLVGVGVVLSLPGIPGQGLLTILLGVLLVDIPGKRRVERAIVRIGAVRRSIDRLRARFGRAPLELP